METESRDFKRGYQYARVEIDTSKDKPATIERLEAESLGSFGPHDFDKGIRQCLFDENRPVEARKA